MFRIVGAPVDIGRSVRGGLQQQRKIRQLKVLTSWFLQNTGRQFGDYNYGCHCNLDASPGILGVGKMVDDTDRACNDHSQCYRCLGDAYEGECDGHLSGYRAELFKDEITGKPWMECTNKIDTCRYNICQCDKALAESLAHLASGYDPDYYNSPFILTSWFGKETECVKQNHGLEKSSGSGGFQGCCGDKSTFPFNQPRNAAQCCDGYEAKPFGSC